MNFVTFCGLICIDNVKADSQEIFSQSNVGVKATVIHTSVGNSKEAKSVLFADNKPEIAEDKLALQMFWEAVKINAEPKNILII